MLCAEAHTSRQQSPRLGAGVHANARGCRPQSALARESRRCFDLGSVSTLSGTLKFWNRVPRSRRLLFTPLLADLRELQRHFATAVAIIHHVLEGGHARWSDAAWVHACDIDPRTPWQTSQLCPRCRFSEADDSPVRELNSLFGYWSRVRQRGEAVPVRHDELDAGPLERLPEFDHDVGRNAEV